MPTNAPIEGVQPGTLDATVSGATEEEPLPPGVQWLWDRRSLLGATAILAAWIPLRGMAGGALPLLCIVGAGWLFEIIHIARAVAREHSSPRQVMPPIREDQDPTLNPIQEKT